MKIITLAFLLVVSQSAFAKFYKCDVDGKSIYQDKPCPKLSGEEIKVQVKKDTNVPIYISENPSNSEGLSVLKKIPSIKFKVKEDYEIEDIMNLISSLELGGKEASGCKIEMSIYYNLEKDSCKRFFNSYLVPYYEAKYNISYILKNNKEFDSELMSYIDKNLDKINREMEYFQNQVIPLKQVLQRNL